MSWDWCGSWEREREEECAMTVDLSRIDTSPKSGDERFHAAGDPLGFALIDFWRWSASDLTSNALRGVLAEYFVARAVGAHAGARTEWDACDLKTADGARIEVKSSAYVQSWAQKKHSVPSFNIALTRGWDAFTNTYAETACRSADVYVFALFHHQDKVTADPHDVTQWTFYVLPAGVLNDRCPTQRTIGLASLLKLDPKRVAYVDLAKAVSEALVGDPRAS